MSKALSNSRRPFGSRIPAAAACSADQMTEIATSGPLLATRKWPPEPFQPEFNLDSTKIQPSRGSILEPNLWSRDFEKTRWDCSESAVWPKLALHGAPKTELGGFTQVSLRFHSGFTQVSRPSPSLCAIRPCQETPAACFCGAKQKLRRQFGWHFGSHPVEFMPSRRCSTPISEAALRCRACRKLR